MKKSFLAAASLLLLGGGLAACSFSGASNPTKTSISRKNFAYQAVSSVSLTSSGAQNRVLASLRALRAVDDAESIKKNIESFLPEADLILEGKGKPSRIDVLESDLAEYTNKESIVSLDLLDNESTITLYYNSVPSTNWDYLEDEEIEDEQDDDDSDQDETDEVEEDEDEYVFSDGTMLEGLIQEGEATYHFQSKQVSIAEEDEKTEKIAFRVSLDETYASCVLTTYEVEQEDNETEESFVYEVYEAGTRTLEFEVDLPKESDRGLEFEVNDHEYLIASATSYNESEGHFLLVYEEEEDKTPYLVYQRVQVESSFTYSQVI